MKKEKFSIALLGPTASGKTVLSLEIARKLEKNIVNCDSCQFMKEMQILSCSPTPEQTREFPHFLFNILENQKPNLGLWIEKISNIDNKLIVGGNGFYLNSLEKGVPNIEISEETQEKKKNIENWWKFLKDNKMIGEIHQNDFYRIERKLDFFLETGQDFESFPKKYSEKIFKILLLPDKEKIMDNIVFRTESFINKAIQEVEIYKSKGEIFSYYSRVIGFSEILDYLEGNISNSKLIENINLRSFQYAKQQMKFFRKMSFDLRISEPLIEPFIDSSIDLFIKKNIQN